MANKAQVNLKYSKGYGENYKALRKSLIIKGKSCTIRQLEAEFIKKGVGISYTTISDIENEQREPTVEQVQIYQNFFDVPIDYLTGKISITNRNIIDICKYTGLSQEAIENIEKHKSKTLSKVLESNEFWEVIKILDIAQKNKDILNPSGENVVLSTIAGAGLTLDGQKLDNIPPRFINALSAIGQSGFAPVYKQQISDYISALFDNITKE